MTRNGKYILAIDQGTTSSRALVVDHEGNIISFAQKHFRQIYPKPGWIEHDPTEIWSTQSSVMMEAVASAKLSFKEIAVIGIANQRETTVVWDKTTSIPIGNAIVWQDRRTAKMCEQLKADGYETLFREKTGLLIDPYFSGTKLKWILENNAQAASCASRGNLAFGTIDSWLIWKLTGGELHATDATNASRTLLYNIHTGQWDEELLQILGIPRSALPEVRNSSEIYGECSKHVCSAFVPIGGVAGDQQAAFFGQGCFEKGMGKITYGTGCFVLMNTGSTPPPISTELITTIGCQVEGKVSYALEGSVFMAGAVVDWLKDHLGMIKKPADIEALARKAPSSNGVVFVPSLTGLGAPYWDPHAKGMIAGITRSTEAKHIARAALEGIAFQVADVIKAMQEHLPIKELRIDGGVTENRLLMEIQTDLLRLPLLKSRSRELTALGAAYLAGLSIGYWKNQEEIAKQWQEKERFAPNLSINELSEKRRLWKKGVRCARIWGEEMAE